MKAATDQKICGCSIKRTGIAVQDGSLILGKRICKYNARHHRVIYMNTFGKTLAPGIRISYMVLPEKLMEKCRTSAEKSALPIQKISGGDCGTHLLVKLDTDLADMQIRWAAKQRGIGVSCLSQYCAVADKRYDNTLVMTYSNVDRDVLEEAVRRLEEIF